MNLHYTLPDREQELLAGPLHGQKLRYCVPYDLDKEGNLCGDGWIAVTGERLYILKDGAIADSIDLAAADAILCVPQIDSGLLLVKQGEKERLLCRFTMRHMVRCSYVARGTDVLCRGDGREVVGKRKSTACAVDGFFREPACAPAATAAVAAFIVFLIYAGRTWHRCCASPCLCW